MPPTSGVKVTRAGSDSFLFIHLFPFHRHESLINHSFVAEWIEFLISPFLSHAFACSRAASADFRNRLHDIIWPKEKKKTAASKEMVWKKVVCHRQTIKKSSFSGIDRNVASDKNKTSGNNETMATTFQKTVVTVTVAQLKTPDRDSFSARLV